LGLADEQREVAVRGLGNENCIHAEMNAVTPNVAMVGPSSGSTITITGSTFVGNSAVEKGGGVYNDSSAANANVLFSPFLTAGCPH